VTQASGKSRGTLYTALGRRRSFFGRLNDDTTIREAIANEPQSLVGDIANLGIYRVWHDLEPYVQVLAQMHDAGLFQVREASLEWAISQIRTRMTVPVSVNSKTMTIPVGIAVGYNWAKTDKRCTTFADGNPGGMADWEDLGNDIRKVRPETEILDRRFQRIYARQSVA